MYMSTLIKENLKKGTIHFLLTLAMMFLFFDTSSVWASGRDVLNVDFENGSLNFLPRGGDENLLISDEDSHSGNYSLKTTGRNATWNGPALEIFQWITPGYEYEISVWVRLIEGEADDFMLSSQIGRYGSANYVNIAVLPVKKEDEWVQLKGRLEYPHNAPNFITVYVEHDDRTAEYYIDDLVITELGALSLPETQQLDVEQNTGMGAPLLTAESGSRFIWGILACAVAGVLCVIAVIMYYRKKYGDERHERKR